MTFLVDHGTVSYTHLDVYKRQEQEPVTEVPRHHDNSALPISTDIHDIFDLALNQNFVPVVDDRGIFIGIITRKNILQHCCNIDR